MTAAQVVILWGIAAGTTIFILLWSLGYLVCVGVVVELCLKGYVDWKTGLKAIMVMILIWPVILGMTMSQLKLPTPPDPN